jgi:hypothetical protein
MKKADLIQIMVDLELANEELKAELEAFDDLMRRVGFANGIQTVKATADELTKGCEE